MFIHNFKYSLKVLLKKKALIFWTFIFPIILGTFFSLAFSNIEEQESFNLLDIAIVENEEFNNNIIFKSAFKELSSKDNKDRVFNTKYTDLDKAKKLLKDKKISGYVVFNNGPQVVIYDNGINETILKSVVDEILVREKMITTLTTEEVEKQYKTGNYNIDTKTISNKVNNIIENSNYSIKKEQSNNLDYSMIEFYTLIAMVCLYGAMLSMSSINNNIPNMSNVGKRTSIAPTHKFNTIISSLLASFIVQLVGLAILFLYTIFILKVDYGNNILLIVLLSINGSLAGTSLGLFISTLFKKNENTKTGLIIAITMAGCFFSGMMGITMKYIIDKNIPIINMINPASMITDGFYALYYYNTYSRYLYDMISLLVFSSILVLISYLVLRREKYDSI